jgi:hypothetical protein
MHDAEQHEDEDGGGSDDSNGYRQADEADEASTLVLRAAAV